jgi:hypothetical protein
VKIAVRAVRAIAVRRAPATVACVGAREIPLRVVHFAARGGKSIA